MPAVAGSVWVEGDYLHFCPTTTTEYRYLGTFVANRSTAVSGSIWIDGANLRYIDADKDERVLPLGSASSPAGVSSAINGSVWIENNRICAIEGTTKQKREYHTDTSFENHSDHDDCAYSDNGPHSDNYTNHGDFSGGYFHVDQYSDSGFHYDFNDCASYHQDSSSSSHTDVPEYVGTV